MSAFLNVTELSIPAEGTRGDEVSVLEHIWHTHKVTTVPYNPEWRDLDYYSHLARGRCESWTPGTMLYSVAPCGRQLFIIALGSIGNIVLHQRYAGEGMAVSNMPHPTPLFNKLYPDMGSSLSREKIAQFMRIHDGLAYGDVRPETLYSARGPRA